MQPEMKLCPHEPTEAMIEAWINSPVMEGDLSMSSLDAARQQATADWQAAYDAALSPAIPTDLDERARELLAALKAIAEGYPVRGEEDRYISVENPDFQADNGSAPCLIIDTFALTLPTADPATREAALREAAAVCKREQQGFLSPDYAVGQPMSSFMERFACGQCEAAILSRIEGKSDE